MKIYNTTIKQLIDYLSSWPVDDKKYQVEVVPQSDDLVETDDIIVEHNVSGSTTRVTDVTELVNLIQSIAINILETQTDVFTTSIQPQALVTTEQAISKGVKKSEVSQSQHGSSASESVDSSNIVEHVMKTMQLLTNRRVEDNYVNCILEDISSEYGKLLSVTRHTGDKMCVVINTGTRKFDNVSGNQLLFALHVAECIFREVLYNEKGNVDIQQLDELLDVFYDLMFKNLENVLNT